MAAQDRQQAPHLQRRLLRSMVIRQTQMVVFVDYVCASAMRTVLPYYARSLGAPKAATAFLEALYGVGQVVGAVSLGRFSDRHGRKIVLTLSFAGSSIGYALAALAVSVASPTLLFMSRLPVGCAKQTVTASRAICADVSSSSAERSAAYAQLFSFSALGYSFGPYLGGLLLDKSTHKQFPAIVCSLIFILLMPASRAMPETRARAEAKTASTADCSNPILFVKSILVNARVCRLALACALPEACVLVAVTALPMLAHDLSWSATRLGAFNSAWGMLAALFSLFCIPAACSRQLLTDRLAAITGCAIIGAGAALLCSHTADASLWASLALYAPAVALLRTSPASLLSGAAPGSQRGATLGLLDAVGSLCRVVAPLCAGLIASAYGTNAAFGFQAALAAAGGLLLMGIETDLAEVNAASTASTGDAKAK